MQYEEMMSCSDKFDLVCFRTSADCLAKISVKEIETLTQAALHTQSFRERLGKTPICHNLAHAKTKARRIRQKITCYRLPRRATMTTNTSIFYRAIFDSDYSINPPAGTNLIAH
jgi:hypothetical protein